MNQELIQTLAEIGVELEASETRLAIRAVDQARLRSASPAYMEETVARLSAAGMDMQALAAQGIGVEVVNDHHFILFTADKGKLTASLEAARKAEFTR